MSKHHSTTRVLAALLSALMTLSAAELPVWAGDWQENEAEEEIGSLPAVIHTPNGDVEIEEDWNEVYPYGTFAFGTYQADVAEPGALTADGEEIPQTVLIPVYRLGGTVGRVTAKIQYSPAVTMDPDGVETIYDYAASGKNDLLIEYEAPTAAAAFQPVGLPESVRRMLPAEDAAVTFDAEGLNAETLTEDDELSLFLAGDPHADAYTWQARVGGGDWQDIDGGADPTLLVTWGEIWDFENDTWNALDFRCIYSLDGKLYCAESLFGERYEPLDSPEGASYDTLQDLAEADSGEGSFTVLEFEEEFDAYEFLLTFAEGETVKTIRVSALDDDTPELPELGLFTITGCEGGDISDTCNTLTLLIRPIRRSIP